MIKTISKLLTISILISIYSCSETNDVTPNQDILGTWKFQTASGSAIVGSKSLDLKEDLVVSDNGTTIKVKKVMVWTFKVGGVGTNDGIPFTYTINGNKLLITQNGILFSLNIFVDNAQMTVNEDDTGLKSLLDVVNNYLSTNNKITKYSRTLIYRSLSDILATNGTPDCVTKGYTISSGDGKIVDKYSYSYVYNDENKVVEYSYPSLINNQTVISKYTFQEYKENLGSADKPYVIEMKDNALHAKYYCDKNGRVSKKEYFSYGSFPSSIDYEEYDSNGNHIKSTNKVQNSSVGTLTGEFEVLEGVYENGNLTKFYYSNAYNLGKIVTKRYLLTEYKMSSTPNKNIISYLFNYGINDFGEGNKNLIDKRIRYNEDGTILRQGTFVYKLDSKGFLISSDITYSDGSTSGYSGYSYQCK